MVQEVTLVLVLLLIGVVLMTTQHANEQRSAIEAKLDWILSRQADHETRLTVLENAWLNYDEHPSQHRR